MRKTLKQYGDIILAFLLFSACLAGCLCFYGLIFNTAEAYTSPLPSLSPGKRTFGIFFHNSCVGRLNTEFKESKLYELYLKGKISTTQNGVMQKVVLSGSAFFNPLGQMIQAKAEITSLPSAIRVSAQNVTPITLNVKAENPQGIYNKDFLIPGPLVLQKAAGSKEYLLSYPHAQDYLASSRFSALSLLAPLSAALRLSEEGADNLCRDDRLTPLDLSLAAVAVQAFLAQQKQGPSLK
jgi:hypothetical protein